MEKNSNLLVSIIMPVYNAADYLEQTLKSVLNSGSDTDSLELIVVNDGSVDASPDILNAYRARYHNLKVINQENSGPSAARNRALDQARGKFIFFLDSDDLVEMPVLLEMCEKAETEEADLVIAKYDFFNEYRRYAIPSIGKLTRKEIIEWNNPKILWTFALWNKLFRRTLIEETGQRFPNTNYSEDGVFVMNYVYHSAKIIGYNRVVLHYRRMTAAVKTSITATVSESKFLDYIASHEMIYESLCQKCMKENPGFEDFKTLCQNNREVNDYANEFLRKEINILLNQFYRSFWTLDRKLIRLIAENISDLLQRVDLKSYHMLSAGQPEVSLRNLPVTYEEAINSAVVTVLLYGEADQAEDFLACLNSLLLQQFLTYQIFVPESMREYVGRLETPHYQVAYVKAENERELLRMIPDVRSSYILIANPAFIYEKSALKLMYKKSCEARVDYLTSTIFIINDHLTVPCSLQGRSIIRNQFYRNGHNLMREDCLLANKMIAVPFLQRIYQEGDGQKDLTGKLARQGYYTTNQNCAVIFPGEGEDALLSLMGLEKTEADRKTVSFKLADERFETDELEVYKKLRFSNKKNRFWKRRIIYMLSSLPVKDRILIFSIRRDGELDDNLKYVEPYIKGKKVILSKRLPHDSLFKLKMYYYIATSKVIVTDDYVRYLRLFPLKREQRVIQLWHACGAFKKFGVQGTTMSLKMERSTHIQYNLVCVSAEGVRDIYARAFDIAVKNVAALGTPRTDLFFDQAEMDKRKQAIYERYPAWAEKEIILYAPTFRDKKGDRTKFQPELDFDLLSGQLAENQIFVIAPHPIMKEKILPVQYDNIVEIRDIHTLDLMLVSSRMVTDYSSVIFEYALLKKPVLFFCYDLEDYERGFYLSYEHDLPGKVVRTQEELVQSLTDKERDILDEQYDVFAEKYMGACDGNSSQRIANLINQYMEG